MNKNKSMKVMRTNDDTCWIRKNKDSKKYFWFWVNDVPYIDNKIQRVVYGNYYIQYGHKKYFKIEINFFKLLYVNKIVRICVSNGN